MAYLAWVASELGSATGFPNGNIIPQKPQREEIRSVGRAPRRPSHTPRRYSSQPNWPIPGLSANRKLSGFDCGISPVKSACKKLC